MSHFIHRHRNTEKEYACMSCGSTHLVSIQSTTELIPMYQGDELQGRVTFLKHEYEGNVVNGIEVCASCGRAQGTWPVELIVGTDLY